MFVFIVSITYMALESYMYIFHTSIFFKLKIAFTEKMASKKLLCMCGLMFSDLINTLLGAGVMVVKKIYMTGDLIKKYNRIGRDNKQQLLF